MKNLTVIVFLLAGCAQLPGGGQGGGDGGVVDGGSRPGDLDGDGIPDNKDLDADGDGVVNIQETSFGLDPNGDHDKDGVPNYLDPDDRGDGEPSGCLDAPEGPGTKCVEVSPIWDVDMDGIANHLDTDSDGDGVGDMAEFGISSPCEAVVGLNGFCDAWETAPDSGVSLFETPDVNEDAWPDQLDPSFEQTMKLPADRTSFAGTGTKEGEDPAIALGVPKFSNSAIPTWAGDFHYSDQTTGAGLDFPQGGSPLLKDEQAVVAGVAADDIDGDGDIDLYLTRSEYQRFGPQQTLPPVRSAIMRNNGDGTFKGEEHDPTRLPVAPLFLDKEGDGDLDLVVTSIDATKTGFYVKVGDSFLAQEVPVIDPSYSASAGDYDGDGLPDLFLTHRLLKNERQPAFLLRNLGSFYWKDITNDARVPIRDQTATALWADVDNDFWPDLLITADVGQSVMLLNRGDRWLNAPTTLTDENASGQATGDIDNDGDIDWFVSGIGLERRDDLPSSLAGSNVGISGNRLLRNTGGGTFADITDEAFVRYGWWAWAACIADLNNDGWQDVVQVNGWPQGVFDDAATSVWLNGGPKGFLQARTAVGVNKRQQGRGLVCADFDGDGDIDILAVNQGGAPTLWRNDNAASVRSWLEVDLQGVAPNTRAIGAKVIVRSATLTQMREVQAGSSYLSQAPARLHFGLASDEAAEVTVIWPNRKHTVVNAKLRTVMKINQGVR